MKADLDHLSPLHRRQLRFLASVIVKAVRPEKIILYGMYGTDDTMPTGYDLLLITRRGEHRHDHDIQDIIENKCRIHAIVTVLVHDIDHVNLRLSEGQYFFSLLGQEGTLLYDAGNVPLVPAAAPDLIRIRQTAQKDFDRWSRQARVFFESAVFNQQKREYWLAVFLLHQAAEQIYQAILLTFMGYKPCTHNLDKLRRYTHRFSIELALLFPRDAAGDDHLFKLLLSSYVDARYKEDYHITEYELQQLTQRIERLLSIARRICHNRFISLEKMAAARRTRHL
ncbi:MAG TPA: HEPN domain-containing protein [Puia sp.]|nr:HEPN domain-containing protein [Puia sp.]